MSYKEYHPPHIYFDDTIYFITSRTVNKEKFFATNAQKNILYSCLKAGLQKFKIPIYAFAILDNHYHLMIRLSKAGDLPLFIKHLNGRSSFELNKLENKPGRKIWYQYFDRCIRDQVDFWRHFNYIHNNPVKHGQCRNLAEAESYPFSSAGKWVKIKGEEWWLGCFREYPIVDFTAVSKD